MRFYLSTFHLFTGFDMIIKIPKKSEMGGARMENQIKALTEDIVSYGREGILIGEQKKEFQDLFLELAEILGSYEAAIQLCEENSLLTPHLRELVEEAQTQIAA